MAQIVNNLPAMQEKQVQSLAWEDPLEKEMATHSSKAVQLDEECQQKALRKE